LPHYRFGILHHIAASCKSWLKTGHSQRRSLHLSLLIIMSSNANARSEYRPEQRLAKAANTERWFARCQKPAVVVSDTPSGPANNPDDL
jgi:hypothetical protein